MDPQSIISEEIGHAMTLQEIGNLKPPFVLPDLPFATGSLAPSIDQRTMEIHHGQHHQAYIDHLNKLIANEKDKKDLQTIITHLKGKDVGIRNNAGGHWNHTFFWSVLTGDKEKSKMPQRMKQEIEKNFGTIDKFKEQFEKAGVAQFGSGWVWLIRDASGKLAITTTSNQDNPMMDIALVKGRPIYVVDVWEHAYYLTYLNMRPDYLKAIWNVTNWSQVDSYDREVSAH